MTQGAEIRFADAADVEPICELLASGFAAVPLPFWRNLLAYPWLPAADKPDLGAVVVADSRIVGYLGTMYSNRVVEGRPERFCNLFAWYVRPEYRHYALPLLLLLVQRPNITFVNVTPADHVVTIFKRLGFTLADEQRFICTPRAISLLSHRPRVQIVKEEEVNEALLGAVNYRIFQDHFGHSVRRFVLAAGGDVCLLITKRMSWYQVRFPRTDLYYVSNREFLARHFDQILIRLLRRDKAVALHADPRQLGFKPRGARTIPAAALYPCTTLIRSERVPSSAIDRLYTELVMLP
jgi:acetoacetyl-CoA synthetase